MKKTIVLLFIIFIMINLSACKENNKPHAEAKNSSEETDSEYEYHDDYDDSLDLSAYNSWGEFGEDKLMWVEKSDYSGKSFGYINEDGEIVIPFSDKISKAHDFNHGYAIVCYELDAFDNGPCAIIDTKGNVVSEFITHPSSVFYYLENGNIYFTTINLINETDSSAADTYMFCAESKTIKKMPQIYDNSDLSFSDGLIMIYSSYDYMVRYYDSEGNCVIDVSNSNSYYKSIKYAEKFINGRAEITFVGLDDNWYVVIIDKSGKWVNEPSRIDESSAKHF